MFVKTLRNWNHCVLLARMYNGADSMESNVEVPQKFSKSCHMIWWSLLQIYKQRICIQSPKEIFAHCMFTAALLSTARRWKEPKCPPTDDWIKKMWYTYIYIHMEIIVSLKKGYPVTCSNMDITSEIHQSQKDKYYMIPLLRGSKSNSEKLKV